LNRTAALVWRHCDGKTTVAEMSRLLQRYDLPPDEAVVWLALDRLEKARLLQSPLIRSAEAAGISRRAVIRRLGMVGGLVALLPLVDSLVVPAAAQNASPGGDPNGDTGGCLPQGAPCTDSSQCCSLNCDFNCSR
jgi:hypothetical protein